MRKVAEYAEICGKLRNMRLCGKYARTEIKGDFSHIRLLQMEKNIMLHFKVGYSRIN